MEGNDAVEKCYLSVRTTVTHVSGLYIPVSARGGQPAAFIVEPDQFRDATKTIPPMMLYHFPDVTEMVLMPFPAHTFSHKTM